MKAAFFDVDGTLTETRVWNGLMDYFQENNTRRGINITFQVFHYFLYFLSRIRLLPQVRFREIWAKNLSWYLKGYSLEEADGIWDWVVRERIDGQWRPQTLARLQEHSAAGDKVFLVSGGPEGLLRRIAAEIGADYVVGTRHVVENGVYTGKAALHACQGEKKATLTKHLIEKQGLEIDLDNSYAYADSLGDIHLLEMVGNPVAVFPDEHLKPVVEERGWPVIDSDSI